MSGFGLLTKITAVEFMVCWLRLQIPWWRPGLVLKIFVWFNFFSLLILGHTRFVRICHWKLLQAVWNQASPDRPLESRRVSSVPKHHWAHGEPVLWDVSPCEAHLQVPSLPPPCSLPLNKSFMWPYCGVWWVISNTHTGENDTSTHTVAVSNIFMFSIIMYVLIFILLSFFLSFFFLPSFFLSSFLFFLSFPFQESSLSCSFKLCHSYDNTKSLNHCAKPGIKHTPSQWPEPHRDNAGSLTHCATVGTPDFVYS